MSEIETLSEEERAWLEGSMFGDDVASQAVSGALEKALRIHDAQAARILELEAEARTADDLLARWLADFLDDVGCREQTNAFITRGTRAIK